MVRKFSTTLLIITLYVGTAFAGIRAPGKYSGIVIFDRWDTCYLYSGIYLMYVSEKTKEKLRKYEGQSVFIYAKEVFQPINPGDGLIGKYKFLGLAKSKGAGLSDLTLKIVPQFAGEGAPKFLLEIENKMGRAVSVSPGALALTLLGAKRDKMFSPSDGKSDAWITRQPFKHPSFIKEMFPKKSKYITWGDNDEFYFDIDENLPDAIDIQPNQKREISLSFHLPKGEYDFLCGYGGGVHEEKGLVSNIVAFTVDDNGKAKVNDVIRHNGAASNNGINRTRNQAAFCRSAPVRAGYARRSTSPACAVRSRSAAAPRVGWSRTMSLGGS